MSDSRDTECLHIVGAFAPSHANRAHVVRCSARAQQKSIASIRALARRGRERREGGGEREGGSEIERDRAQD